MQREPLKFKVRTINHKDYPDLIKAGERAGVLFNDRKTIYLGAFSGGEIIAIAGLTFKPGGTVGTMKGDYTKPEFRRRGILGALIRIRLRILRDNKVFIAEANATDMALNTHVLNGAIPIKRLAASKLTLVRYENFTGPERI